MSRRRSRRSQDDRGSLYLLTGLVLGLILGVVYAWLVQPPGYTDTSPDTLRQDFKDRYRALIAAAYAANGDLVRAKARLDLLGDPEVSRALAEQAQRTLAEGNAPSEAQNLGLLAVALGQAPGPGIAGTQAPSPSPAFESPTASTPAPETPGSESPVPTSQPGNTGAAEEPATVTFLSPAAESSLAFPEETPEVNLPATSLPEIPVPSVTTAPASPTTPAAAPFPRPTDTPRPTPTASRTPGAPFTLQSQERACETLLAEPQVQVTVLDASGQDVPGVEILVSWDEGEERFYTGLQPEKGAGYADYDLDPDKVYSLHLGAGTEPVENLEAVSCRQSGQSGGWGAWVLVFVQP